MSGFRNFVYFKFVLTLYGGGRQFFLNQASIIFFIKPTKKFFVRFSFINFVKIELMTK